MLLKITSTVTSQESSELSEMSSFLKSQWSNHSRLQHGHSYTNTWSLGGSGERNKISDPKGHTSTATECRGLCQSFCTAYKNISNPGQESATVIRVSTELPSYFLQSCLLTRNQGKRGNNSNLTRFPKPLFSEATVSCRVTTLTPFSIEIKKTHHLFQTSKEQIIVMLSM